MSVTAKSSATAPRSQRGWITRMVFEESLRAFLQQDESSTKPEPFRLAHTVVRGVEFPDMTFADMLEATNPGRL